MAYKYGYRLVKFLRSEEAVERELQEIYAMNNDGKDIMSLTVIPLTKDDGFTSLPYEYQISYVYRYEGYDGNNDL